VAWALPNTFQKRSVSSPAPVTIVWPSGDIACPGVSDVTGVKRRDLQTGNKEDDCQQGVMSDDGRLFNG
jgi:hypothetical protein